MLSVQASESNFLHMAPTGMRKGIDGLSGIVRGECDGNPLDESLYLFVNRRGERFKILQWDGSGFWIYYRVLERGTLQVPRVDEKRMAIDATQSATPLIQLNHHSIDGTMVLHESRMPVGSALQTSVPMHW